MALMLPRSIFFHIPKTGGMWVRLAIQNAGIPAFEVGISADRTAWVHDPYTGIEHRGRFAFAFVRHPAAWYASFWAARRWNNPRRRDDLLDSYMSEDFGRFLLSVLRDLPGHLSGRFERYAGPPPGALDFVGKQENLVEDLIRALRMAGEEFDEESIRSTPPQNVSQGQPGYTPELTRALLESEWKAMVRFGYAQEAHVLP